MHSAHFCNIAICLLLASPIPVYSMEYQLTPIQDQVLQIVLLNRLQRHDFEGVSHIIQKTPIKPGKSFIGMLDDKMNGSSFKNGTIDCCYELYIYAKQLNHLRTLNLLKDQDLFMHICSFATLKSDIQTAYFFLSLPDWSQIVTTYNKSISAKNTQKT